MALSVPKAPGFTQMLKEGSKHFSGLEEAVYRNIEACKELSNTTRSAYGPHGQNKMVINHIEKLFVTNDAATILRELDVQHPAAKMLVMAAQQQEQECGDGTNFVLIFAGALLEQAEELLRMGLSVTDVIEGYDLACKKAIEILPELESGRVENLRDKEMVNKIIRPVVMSKQYGYEDFLSNLITDACISVLPITNRFNVDHIRICKIVGTSVTNSSIVQGMVFKRQVEGDITKAESCKVAVYSCPLDIMQTETKGTVLLKSAQELKEFSKGEESVIREQIEAIASTGCKVVVTGGKVGELALHYANQYGLMVVRLMSKWDLRRLCRAIKATPLPRLTPPTAEEAGHCDSIRVNEIGDTPVIIFKQEKEDSAIATVIIRGSTDNILDDIERAIDDGVNTFKSLTKDHRYVPGAGATEIELAKRIAKYGGTSVGLQQYAIEKFAQALEALPRAMAENTGVKAMEVISKLYAAHQDNKTTLGLDIDSEIAAVKDVFEMGVFDLLMTKHWGVKFATSAANTVLRVDQIIMAKAAGGPKPKDNPNWDGE